MNGAYYGPPMAPPTKAYHRGRRSSSSCCCCCICNPFACCCRCIFDCIANCILQILCIILVLFGILCLIIWLLFKPNKVNFNVIDASLTKFNFIPAKNALIYDLSLNVTVENTNKRLEVQYYTIEAGAFYEDIKFANIILDPFYQPVENVSFVQTVFRGQNTVALGDQEVYGYFKDKYSGIFEIDVKLYLRMGFKFFSFIQSPKFKPTVDCDLKIPINVNGKSSGTFQHTECGYAW